MKDPAEKDKVRFIVEADDEIAVEGRRRGDPAYYMMITVKDSGRPTFGCFALYLAWHPPAEEASKASDSRETAAAAVHPSLETAKMNLEVFSLMSLAGILVQTANFRRREVKAMAEQLIEYYNFDDLIDTGMAKVSEVKFHKGFRYRMSLPAFAREPRRRLQRSQLIEGGIDASYQRQEDQDSQEEELRHGRTARLRTADAKKIEIVEACMEMGWDKAENDPTPSWSYSNVEKFFWYALRDRILFRILQYLEIYPG
ncbi:hypothetical protein MMC17_001620 [Xylographa soralifera]|nr:hypothetical protein [Xylographa soralifera]